MNREMRDRLRAAYDAMAEERDRRTLPAWKRRIRAAFLEILREEGRTGLLEIGSGSGRDGAFFAGEGLKVVCIDLSSEMVRLCLEKGLEAYVMDVADLRFPDGSFDAAYAFNSFLHLADAEWPEALREVRRVLRPGGAFFLGVYGGFDSERVWDEDTYEPKRFFSFHSDDRLLELVAGDYEVVSLERVAVESAHVPMHFQSLVLRRKGGTKRDAMGG